MCELLALDPWNSRQVSRYTITRKMINHGQHILDTFRMKNHILIVNVGHVNNQCLC